MTSIESNVFFLHSFMVGPFKVVHILLSQGKSATNLWQNFEKKLTSRKPICRLKGNWQINPNSFV
jgi:hypothetical protein